MKPIIFAISLSLVSLTSLADTSTAQCKVVSEYQGAYVGCPGNPDAPGLFHVKAQMKVTAGKSYYAEFTLLDKEHNVIQKYPAHDMVNATKSALMYVGYDYLDVDAFGEYKIQAQVFDAETDTPICSTEVTDFAEE